MPEYESEVTVLVKFNLKARNEDVVDEKVKDIINTKLKSLKGLSEIIISDIYTTNLEELEEEEPIFTVFEELVILDPKRP